MSQISYDIYSCLLKKDCHIRGLAKELGTNQMTVSRKASELRSMNVLDYRVEGKNKVYFIKDSMEAKEYAKIMEHDKLLSLIRKKPRIRLIVQELWKNNRVKLAVLFGSYAKGTEKNDSDIDIYFEKIDAELKKEIELIDSRINVKTGEFDKENPLVKEIMKNHVILKGVDKYYEQAT